MKSVARGRVSPLGGGSSVDALLDAVVWSDTNFLPNFLPELPNSPSSNLTLPSLFWLNHALNDTAWASLGGLPCRRSRVRVSSSA